MKKSTLLSLATAGAIVATSAGTYAAWDTLNVEETAHLDFGKPVVLSMTEFNDAAATKRTNLNDEIKIEATAKINVKNPDNLGSGIVLTPTIAGDVALTPGTHYSLNIVNNDNQGTVSEVDANTKFKDTNFSDGDKTYKITITLKEPGKDLLKTNSKSNTLTLKAELQ